MKHAYCSLIRYKFFNCWDNLKTKNNFHEFLVIIFGLKASKYVSFSMCTNLFYSYSLLCIEKILLYNNKRSLIKIKEHIR